MPPGSPTNARKSSGERMSASVMSSSPSSGAIGSLRSMTPSCGRRRLDDGHRVAILRDGERGAARLAPCHRHPRAAVVVCPPRRASARPARSCSPSPAGAAAGAGADSPARSGHRRRRADPPLRGRDRRGRCGRSCGRRGIGAARRADRGSALRRARARAQAQRRNTAKPSTSQTILRSPVKGAPMKITRHANAVTYRVGR